jgi:hypothetical protein
MGMKVHPRGGHQTIAIAGKRPRLSKMKRKLVATLVFTSIASTLQGQQVSTATNDKSQHTSQFVTVAPEVKLEVLDWGGTGRPIVLLAGLGNARGAVLEPQAGHR